MHRFKLPVATVFVQVEDTVTPITGYLDGAPKCPKCNSLEIEPYGGSLPKVV